MTGGILEELARKVDALVCEVANLRERLEQREPAGSALPTTDRRAWLSVAEAAEYSGLSKTTLVGFMNDGTLKWSQPTRNRVINRASLDRLLEGQRQARQR